MAELPTGQKLPVLNNKRKPRKKKAITSRSQFTCNEPIVRLALAKERDVIVQNTATSSAVNSPKWGMGVI